MSKFERFIAQWLAKRLVVQGDHYNKVSELFQIVRDAAGKEFMEDNYPTLDLFLQECLDTTKFKAK